MSEMVPCKKAIEVTDKIIELFEKEQMSFSEVEDVPAELQRRINRNVSCLKKRSCFTDLK